MLDSELSLMSWFDVFMDVALYLILCLRDVKLCAICLEDWRPSDRVQQSSCKHIFHADCITRWLVTHDTCPTCREKVGTIPVVSCIVDSCAFSCLQTYCYDRCSAVSQ